MSSTCYYDEDAVAFESVDRYARTDDGDVFLLPAEFWEHASQIRNIVASFGAGWGTIPEQAFEIAGFANRAVAQSMAALGAYVSSVPREPIWDSLSTKETIGLMLLSMRYDFSSPCVGEFARRLCGPRHLGFDDYRGLEWMRALFGISLTDHGFSQKEQERLAVEGRWFHVVATRSSCSGGAAAAASAVAAGGTPQPG